MEDELKQILDTKYGFILGPASTNDDLIKLLTEWADQRTRAVLESIIEGVDASMLDGAEADKMLSRAQDELACLKGDTKR